MQGEGTVKTMFLTGLAELIGTSILVFVGCMGCVASLGVVPPHLQITLTFGLAVMVAIQVSLLVEKLTIAAPPMAPMLSPYLCMHLKLDKKVSRFHIWLIRLEVSIIQSCVLFYIGNCFIR